MIARVQKVQAKTLQLAVLPRWVLALASCLLLVLLTILFNPVNFTNSYADETAPQAASKEYTVAVSAPNIMQLLIEPSYLQAEAYTEAKAEIKIQTVGVRSYQILLQAVDGENHLRSSDRRNSATLAPVTAEDITQSDPNTWGYALSEASETDTPNAVQALPTTLTSVETVENPTDEAQTFDFALKAKADTSLPSGEYTGGILISVVAQPDIVTLSRVTYMQDVTKEVCTASAEHETARLIDIRDNNRYWVTKMKDGNCWMSQNLALDITTAGLKAADTDITTDWVGSSSAFYPPYATLKAVPSTGMAAQPWGMYSWNLGKFVLATPEGSPSYCQLASGLSLKDCNLAARLIDVSDTTKWTDDYVAQEDTIFNNQNKLVAVHFNDRTTAAQGDYSAGGSYDPHYLVGNYYQFNTISAGMAVNNTSATSMPSSICPKNWKLPLAGSKARGTRSFYYLLSQYATPVSGSDSGDFSYNTARAPFYFVRAGNLNMSNHMLDSVGKVGFYWSRTRQSISGYQSYYFALLGTNTSRTEGYDYYYEGFSVRCLVQGG